MVLNLPQICHHWMCGARRVGSGRYNLMGNRQMTDLGSASPQDEIPRKIDELTGLFARRWWEAGNDPPQFERTYPLREKLRREELLGQAADQLIAELRLDSPGPGGREAQRQRLVNTVRGFAAAALDFDPGTVDAFLGAGFYDCAVEFARQAHAFDPSLRGEDIYQAGRNAWSMNLFQYLFGLEVAVTPAVFAYSLLYPYTDNYLDDPALPVDLKQQASLRLTRRLAGDPASAENAAEERIFSLIEMIEAQFARSRYPQLFASLQAIQAAQVESLALLAPRAAPYDLDVLGISLKKGGAATLADGYLVAGSLTPEQQEFVFGYGAFTQLLDDQEDLARDRKAGLMTVFSLGSRGWQLDGLQNRLFAFKRAALGGMSAMDPGRTGAVAGLVFRGIDLLLIQGAALAGRFYSPRYRAALEAGFPFRFSEFSRQQRRVFRQGVSFERLLHLLTDP